jgi:hypothetical protein
VILLRAAFAMDAAFLFAFFAADFGRFIAVAAPIASAPTIAGE